MATNQYDFRYGYDPTDLRNQKMTSDLMTRPATDPIYDSGAFYNTSGASTPAQVAAAGLRRDDVPGGGVMGGVAGGMPGANGYFGNQPQSASFLGGAGGPNAIGNIGSPMTANQAWSSWGNTNQDMQAKDPTGFALGRNTAYENAQRANLTPQQIAGLQNQSNDQYINNGSSFVKNQNYTGSASMQPYGGQDFFTQLNQARQDPNAFLKNIQGKSQQYGSDPTNAANHLSTLAGADTFLSSLANGGGGGANFSDAQRQQASIDSMIANQLVNAGTSNSHLNQNFLDSIARPQQGGQEREDPFAGQNLNDASVQFQMKQYMQTHPDFVPVNTYKGEAPRLPGEINQDTGMRTMDGVSNQNPWITNKGFVQQMPWQGQQQQQAPYQAPQAQQQQNPYLQPFQQTQQYQKAMNTNYASQNQPQAQSYWGSQGAFGNGAHSSNNFQSPFQSNSTFGKNQFQMNGQQQGGGLLGGNPYGGKNKYGLLG